MWFMGAEHRHEFLNIYLVSLIIYEWINYLWEHQREKIEWNTLFILSNSSIKQIHNY